MLDGFQHALGQVVVASKSLCMPSHTARCPMGPIGRPVDDDLIIWRTYRKGGSAFLEFRQRLDGYAGHLAHEI
jgi:hypothetical protein